MPDGRPGHHSPFAARLLDGLRGGAVKNGIVSFQTLADHLKALKIEPRGNRFGTSKPGATFLFVRRS